MGSGTAMRRTVRLLTVLAVGALLLSPGLVPRAEADEKSSVSGIVTSPDGSAVEGATVFLESMAEPTGCCWSFTGENGRYSFDGVEPSDYLLRVTAPSGSGSAGGWLSDSGAVVSNVGSARVYRAGSSAQVSADAHLRADNATIEGRVTINGSPVEGAFVYIAPHGTPSGLELWDDYANVFTDASGRFVASLRVDGVGAVDVSAAPPASVHGVAGEFFRDATTVDAADPVVLAPGSTVQGVNLDLGASADLVVTTWVSSEGQGKPAAPADATVDVISVDANAARSSWGLSLSSEETKSFVLRPSTVYVRFSAGTTNRYFDVSAYMGAGYYQAPNRVVPTLAEATPVVLTAGRTTSITVVGTRGGSLAGTVTLPGGEALPADTQEGVHVFKADAPDVAIAWAPVNSDGSYRVDGLPSGTYQVVAARLRGARFSTQFAAGGSPDVVVHDGAVTSGIDITAGTTFFDVQPSAPFSADIEWLAAQGITKPGADGKFAPASAVQRSAMAAFLYRAAGSPSYTPPSTSPFVDVATDDAFYLEICWLAQSEITQPGPDHRFGPLEPVSREAMAAFLYRFAGSPTYTAPTTSPFSDAGTNAPFYNEMAWLAAHGITQPGADNKFGPTDPVRREAMAAFLHRADIAGLL